MSKHRAFQITLKRPKLVSACDQPSPNAPECIETETAIPDSLEAGGSGVAVRVNLTHII